MRELIEAEKNVLVLVEHEGGSPPWYMPAYDALLRDTPYRFDDIDGFSCAENRGLAGAPLLLVNHWLTVDPPSREVAENVNRFRVLNERVVNCETERDHMPNIVAVDFYSVGDVFEVVARLNEPAS